MKKPVNPFPTSGYYGVDYFCNRVKETQVLLKNLKGGQSTLLTAIRRMGKTALIKHTLGKLPRGWNSVYLDILYTENETDFLNALASGILSSIPENSNLGKKVWEFIKSMRPLISFDPLSGLPQVSFDFKIMKPDRHVSSMLKFLTSQNHPTVIAIDEFQQILHYPEKHTDAWLRGVIQELPNIFFIYSGSHQHIMTDLFSNPGKPFFRSAQYLKIDKIPENEYSDFINAKFEENKKRMPVNVIEEILRWTNCHTYYVQLICNRVFSHSEKNITSKIWQEEAYKLLKEQEAVFYQYREMMTNPQWQLLKAIAKADQVFEPTSKEFIASYHLGSPSTVLRSLESLLKKELIYRERDATGKPYYGVYDVLFQRWIEPVH